MKPPDVLTVRFGEDFRCHLSLAQLHMLPVENWKKLCRFMSADIFQNETAWGQFAVWFPIAIETAKADRTHAQFLYQSLYADPKTAAKGEKTRTKQRNAYYLKNLTEADRKVKKLEKLYSIFKGDKDL